MPLPGRFASARLVMRPGRADDAAALHTIWSDSAAMTWWTHPPLETLAESRAKLADNLARDDWHNWMITLADGDNAAIGNLAVYEKRQGGVFEIAYAIVPGQWGRGYATEAAGALTDLLFARGARRVCADTDPDNTASNALLARLGFTQEARLRAEWETHIGIRDSLIWGILPGERR